MKKTVLSIIAAFTALCGYAQTADDALLFSENEYEGTARTMAMGNAFTALGGDLGSIGLNPAGSAVARYSSVTLTPGLTFTASTSKGVSPYTSGELPYFDRQMRSNMTNFSVPNVGVMLNFDTNRKSGLKNFTFGFVANKTRSWDEDIFANGINEQTSMMGSMAYYASPYYEGDTFYEGINSDMLGSKDAYYDYPDLWKYITGYQSGMISTFGGHKDQYVGASEVITHNEETGEDNIFLGGPLNQSYGRKVSGAKYDYLLNLGANISDFLYIGANLGITTIEYNYTDYIKESAVDPADFEIGLDDGSTIYFRDMRYKYEYSAEGVGYYGKIGVIITPGAGLRIGAAIQTPTITSISDEFRQSGETSYTDSGYDASATSPWGEGQYTVVSPFRANFGLAYTIGKFGVISADYEICDYSRMKFKSSDDYDREYFEYVNEDIKAFFRPSHSLRVGAEFKPFAELAVRAGYGLTTTPDQYVYENRDLSNIRSQNLSFGLGYSSKKSFFADLAVRTQFIPDEKYMIYDDYLFDENGNVDEKGFAPEILTKKSLWKVVLTLGWRF